MTVKVLIVDDDNGIQLLLKKFVEMISGFKVIGIADNAETALKIVETNEPHIVFMDIELPETNGIDCAKKITDINPKIKIIFATAHEQYMSEAFELYAFDYLVKPFKFDRIKKTLERIKQILEQPYECARSPISNNKSFKKLLIKNKESVSFVNMEDIILVQREDRNTVIYTTEDRYVTSEGLSEFGKRLDKKLFFRSHKSYIINLSMIHKIFPYGRWTYIVKFKNTDKDALITYKKNEELQKMFI